MDRRSIDFPRYQHLSQDSKHLISLYPCPGLLPCHLIQLMVGLCGKDRDIIMWEESESIKAGCGRGYVGLTSIKEESLCFVLAWSLGWAKQ